MYSIARNYGLSVSDIVDFNKLSSNVLSIGQQLILPVQEKIIETDWVNDGSCHIDDCGTIYSNMLYLVKIIVKYCPINALGEFDTSDSTNYKHFYRWMWTNTMFN